MLLRKEEEKVHNEEESLKACNDSARCREMERGWIVWIAVKLMRPWKDLETGRVCLVITVKTCVTNYHVQPANEHRLPDHAPYSITGERDEEWASRGEEREARGSFSPSMTFRLMRPRRTSYFLNLTGRTCPRALADVVRCRWGRREGRA